MMTLAIQLDRIAITTLSGVTQIVDTTILAIIADPTAIITLSGVTQTTSMITHAIITQTGVIHVTVTNHAHAIDIALTSHLTGK